MRWSGKMKLQFKNLIKKYSKEVTIIKQPEAQIVDGRVSEGASQEHQVELAIFPIRPEQIQEYEGGNYTTQDKKIYLPESSEIILEENDVIVDNNNRYEIREKTDWTDFSDFHTYVAVKKVVENND